MSGRIRVVVASVITVLMAGVGTAVAPSATALPPTPSPDSAARTVSRLCTGYDACARAGMSSAGYDKARGTMWWRMYAGHNCTNYAAYRMVRSGMPNVRPWSGGGNATYWGTSMSGITDRTPVVGAVAWWKAYAYPAGSSGHVAYVERVVSADEIIVSQDSWGGDFSWARITKTSGGWPTGFVHFNDVALTSTTRPVVTGTSRVGSVLTASPGTWNPGDATKKYQWRASGEDIAGATTSTLRITPALLDKRIRVRVTASKDGYPTTTARSRRTRAVRPGLLDVAVVPSVVGEERVGATLTADPGQWTATPESVDFQWLADGVPVAGAVEPELTVDPSLVGRSLAVLVTVRKAGYTDAQVTTSPTAPMAEGGLQVEERPVVTGAARVGETVAVTPGAVAPVASGSVRWLRSGVPIRGATGSRYHLTDADSGSRISVRVRWALDGYATMRTRATPTPRVKPVG